MSSRLRRLAGRLTKWWVVVLLVVLAIGCLKGFDERKKAFAGLPTLDGHWWYTPAQAHDILADLDGHRRAYAVSELTLDVVFPVAYAGLFLVLLHVLFPVNNRVLWIPVVVFTADIGENVLAAYLAATWAPSDSAGPAASIAFLAAVCTLTKWCAFFVAIGALVDGTIRRLTRFPDPDHGNGWVRGMSDVLDHELEYIYRRRRRSARARSEVQVNHRDTLIGLSLSGGGIRSATTCLGMFQALSRMKILPLVDYLSTVSGGGYIGSCLSSLLSIDRPAPGARNKPQYSTEWASFPFNPDHREGRAQIDHLRTHGSFLITRTGLLARETMRSLGHLLSGTSYHLGLALLALAIIAFAYMGGILKVSPDLHKTLSEDTPHPYVEQDPVFRAFPPQSSERSIYRYATLVERARHKAQLVRQAAFEASGKSFGRRAVLVSMVYGFALAAALLWYLLRKYQAPGMPQLGESERDARERTLLRRSGVYGLAATLLLFVLARRAFSAQQSVLWLFLPALALLVATVTSFFVHVVIARTKDERRLWNRTTRSLAGAFQAMTSYAFWAAVLLAVFPLATYAVRGTWDAVGISGILSLAAARLLMSRSEPREGTWRIPAAVRNWLLGLAVAAGVFLVLIAITAVLVPADPTVAGAGNAVESFRKYAAAGGLLFLFLGWIVNANRVSPHYFYQDRLGETYLYTESRSNGILEPDRNDFHMALMDLHSPIPDMTDETRAGTAPYHLISAAINLAGSRDLTRKDRKSGYFLFSRYFCGSVHTGFLPTQVYQQGQIRLARAMTISGAAASSGMGAGTFFAQSFATVLFNLRLGYWMPNPSTAEGRKKEVGLRAGWVFWPRWLWREMFMKTNERSALINLSDGGHTGDNVGIYPLLQRRCRVIIACDAEQDGNLTFGSVTEALRHAYIDLGIEVDIDFTMLRPDPETGMSRSHCAVGLIKYPPLTRFGRQEDLPPMQAPPAADPKLIGYLIYLKSSLTGDEPEPVLNYKSDHPAFPHESTVDQFFDDAQFESYRALGVHIAEESLGPWVADPVFEEFRQQYWPF